MAHWLLLEMDNNWQMILPDNDCKPHARVVLIYENEQEALVDDLECPCKPQIDFTYKLIIHNAFDGRK